MRRAWLLAAALLLGAAAPEGEALYQQRFADLMRDGGIVTRYDPMEAVPGARGWRPMAVTASPSIDPAALTAAAEYAAASKASAFMVWRGGKLQAARYFGDVTAATPLLSKSLSKPLSAIAIGRAIALGKIKSLDQPVTDFIPEWRGTPKAGMLVRHLLDMRSGLLEQMFSNDPDHPINRAYIDPDHGRYIVDHYPLTSPPGTKYGYGNAVSELVALVIERATGRRYADFIGREILAPIGAPGGEIWIDRPGGLAHSGCCMRLPAESWLRLGILLADDGVAGGKRLLPRGYVAAMATGTPQNPHFGAGVWVAGPYVERRGFAAPARPGPKILHGEPYLDRDLFLFDGNGSQVVYISRATRLVTMRLGDAPPKSPEWDNSVLPNLLIRGLRLRPGESLPPPQTP
ncbi:serine hydrolase domain-containing protein [Glacieibacterium frigidum]|uniref:Serine hydrolase n=1 Tax=Glacieibacterium frigidum TaxID=2593303 RepID=A0A552U8B9_9SPHN|nr:serine hydrolase [Glacieibacterium frigidum]TRW14451.1 serine hydrolase [Glacieibacterium frigidum]